MSGHMDKDQIEEFLKSQVVGRLGCMDGEKVYVVPITFAYDNGCIYGHTKDGLKIRMMRKNPTVCFETDWVEDLSNWKSVIAHGTYEELDKSEANKGLDILMNKVLYSNLAYVLKRPTGQVLTLLKKPKLGSRIICNIFLTWSVLF